MTQLANLPACRVRPLREEGRPPVLLLHGLGLGAWMWARTQAWLAELGWESWAVDLPGHGPDAGGRVELARWLDAAETCAAELGQPAVVGHSLGGLAAGVVATRRVLWAAVLVSPALCAPLRALPPRRSVPSALGALPGVLTGRLPVPAGARDRLMGLDALAAEDREAARARLSPWPGPLLREALLHPPALRREDLRCRVLMTHGLRDPVLTLRAARLMADHLDCVLWRFDDLAHNGPLEPGGERLVRAIEGWLRRPHGRQVAEVHPLGPQEGVGDEARRQRRESRVRSNSRFGAR